MRFHAGHIGIALTALALIFLWPAQALHASYIYVAPHGTPDGDATPARPLDLVSAMAADGPARPGDTLVLAGGRYDAPRKDGLPVPFVIALRGTEQQPIIITSAPGQWAHINGGIQIFEAAYVDLVRLEIGLLAEGPDDPAIAATTLLNVTHAQGIRLINCNLFGGGRAILAWTPAVNFVAYGNLIHDFGHAGSSHGRAFYMQNDQGTKTLERNIAYRSTDWLYGMYTQQGRVNGFDLIENIGFMAGYHKPGESSYNISLISFQPAERIRVIGNILYQHRDEQQWRSNVRLVVYHASDPIHRDGVVQDNYIIGSYRALCLGRWDNIRVTGNTFWATGYLTEISSAPTGSSIAEQSEHPDLRQYHVDHNTYFANDNDRPFIYGLAEQTREEDRLTFAQWQALGLDTHSQWLAGRDGRPTGTRVFIFDNQYQQGRGQIAVFNWDAQSEIAVDLTTILKPGQAYQIYNCKDIHQTFASAKPVLIGEFDGQLIHLPMRINDEQASDFDVFLILPDGPDHTDRSIR